MHENNQNTMNLKFDSLPLIQFQMHNYIAFLFDILNIKKMRYRLLKR